MEVVNQTKREDNQLLVIMHLSQLLTFITGFGGLIVPLIIWLTQKEQVSDINEQGKAIINFQISLIIFSIICIPLIFVIIGIIGLVIIGLVALIMPIVNAVNASNGAPISYPFSFKFLT
jgi:uncharacterized Tic20 family protein